MPVARSPANYLSPLLQGKSLMALRIWRVSDYAKALVIIHARSEIARMKAIGKRPKVHFEARFAGQPILLLATYEKGCLRPDIMRLITAAKAKGMYVLVVNTLKILNPERLAGAIDCYIEINNFGRDFASYKTGFQHVYAAEWHENCPRVLMVNDSVFFSTRGLDRFIEDMIQTDIEVLGSTENYEIEYHLGSFFISIGSNVLKAKKFREFWKRYRLSDVRPVVIHKGEMKLSKTLKRSVSSDNNIAAQFGAARFLIESNKNFELAEFAALNYRWSESAWPTRMTLDQLVNRISERLIVDRSVEKESENVSKRKNIQSIHIGKDNKTEESRFFVKDFKSALEAISYEVVNAKSIDDAKVREVWIALVAEIFMRHSQIHQNAPLLTKMGLPFVKLDLIYRGMCNIYDMENVSRQFEDHERQELQHLLIARPYGGHVLEGWKRAAFMRGLL